MHHRPLRILFLIDEMEIGGTQRQITRIAMGLDRKRFEPHVGYFRSSSYLVDELREAGVTVHHVPKRRRLDFLFFLDLVRLLKRERFDIVHCMSFTAEVWGVVAGQFVPNCKFISSVRGIYDWYRPWQWRLKRWVALKSTLIVSNSRAAADYATRIGGLPAAKQRIVYNGIIVGPRATANQQNTRAMYGAGHSEVVAVFLGRLVVGKNLSLLLRTLAALGPQLARTVLWVVGDGPDRSAAERLCADLSLTGRVHFLGWRQDVFDLLNAADLLILPSLGEGLSNAILEAMAAGLPVLASDVGGNSELVVHEHTGLLYVSGDIQSFSASLRRLLVDLQLRARLGKQGRLRIEEAFSEDRMISAMQSLYGEAASGALPAPSSTLGQQDVDKCVD